MWWCWSPQGGTREAETVRWLSEGWEFPIDRRPFQEQWGLLEGAGWASHVHAAPMVGVRAEGGQEVRSSSGSRSGAKEAKTSR